MAQNNINHISDDAKYVIFNTAGTSWPASYNNVQLALANIGPWALKSTGLPGASETVAGIARVATQAEVTAGAADNLIVTPKKLAERLKYPAASETVAGIIRIATQTEANALTNALTSITPKSLGGVFNTITANTARFGTVKLSTSPQGQAGTDNTSATTPLIVKEMIAKFTPSPPAYQPATETILGLVYLATTAQAQAGVIREGYAISPYSFRNSNANESQFGTTRLATQGEMNAANDAVAVSPHNIIGYLDGRRANTGGAYGFTSLTNDRGDGNKAFAASAQVVMGYQTINGKQYGQGNISLNAGDVGALTIGEADGRYLPRSEDQRTTVGGPGGFFAAGQWINIVDCYNFYNRNWRCAINLSVKFDRNPDGTFDRFYNFDIRDARDGRVLKSDRINLYNTKGGSKGHKWQFEAFGQLNFTLDVPPGTVLQLVPTSISFATVASVNAVCTTL